MMWPMYTIDDICKVSGGKRLPAGHQLVDDITKHPYIRITDMSFDSLSTDNLLYISEDTFKHISRYTISKDDIYISIAGTIGYVGKIPISIDGANLTENCAKLSEFKQEVDRDYILYYLRSPKGNGELLCRKGGASQPKLALERIKNVPVPVPPINVQQRIANTLSAYDNLIENNRKRIKLLEEASMLLYKEWFVKLRFPNYENTKIVDGVPDGWKRASFNDLCELVKDGCKVKDINTEIPYIGLEHIPRRSICLNEWGNSLEVSSNKYYYQRNDVLFGKIRPYFHKVGFAINEGVCSTDAMVFRAKDNMFSLLLTTAFSDDFVKHSYATCREGSKMPRADWNEMSIYPVMIPNDDLLIVYNDNISRITSAISTISKQIHKLTNARDKLLPKLMSGEIEV